MKESKTLEFKSGKTSSFLKTVSAYANYGVGTIEFGRQDNGDIKGIDNPDQFCLDIENMINDSFCSSLGSSSKYILLPSKVSRFNSN